MARRVLPYVVVGILMVLSGCSYLGPRPERPAWRSSVENACLARHPQMASAWVRPVSALSGPGICGLDHPFKVSALVHGTVMLNSTFTLDCPMIQAMDEWVAKVVQPIAQARLGQPIVAISSMGTYACRTMDNRAGARLSEHSFANAFDVGGFTLADGRTISVVHDWTRGDAQTQAFLRDIEGGACSVFTTVLAPGADRYHYNHFHLDLAMHGNTSRGLRRYCKPAPQAAPLPPRIDNLPDPPQIDEPMDVAQVQQQPVNTRRNGFGGPAPALGLPPQVLALRPLPLGQAIPRHAAPGGGAIRTDGVFVPEGSPEDWDETSSIGSRK